MPCPRPLPTLLAVVAGVGAIGPALAASPSAPAGLDQCLPPAAGTFVVLGSGQHRGEPTALLMQERWLADGRIEGVRYLREGRRFREDRYTGQVKADARCWALVERQGSAGAMAEAVALDQAGRPRTSLVVAPSEVLSLRYVAQTPGACRPEQLDGLVTSQQQGQSWQGGRWQPNAVVQREWWQGGAVQGVAVASYAGRPIACPNLAYPVPRSPDAPPAMLAARKMLQQEELSDRHPNPAESMLLVTVG